MEPHSPPDLPPNELAEPKGATDSSQRPLPEPGIVHLLDGQVEVMPGHLSSVVFQSRCFSSCACVSGWLRALAYLHIGERNVFLRTAVLEHYR